MENAQNTIFLDWLTASQYYPEGGLPIISGGIVVFYDEQGNARFERNSATSLSGSYDTKIRVACDGYRVSISGNVGRFHRQDNLYNHGWNGTRKAVNRILMHLGLPTFSASYTTSCGERREGAVISRLDITANFATGSDAQSRSLIRWLSARSISRMKKGQAGDDSVWFSNTRRMLKAYRKAQEMIAHGASEDEKAVTWAQENGIVRLEVELKKRELSDVGMNKWGDIDDEKIVSLFEKETEVFRQVDRSDEPDILASLPARSRAYASAWLAGQDLSQFVSRATLFRHAKALREYGMDIMEPRNVEAFPVKVRIIDLQPVPMPDWYDLDIEEFGT